MMDGSIPTTPGDRPARPSERVDELCDRFEAAWRAGAAPRIEDYLAEVEAADRAALLRELVALERELRRKRGERPEAQEYLDRFPEHAGVVRAAFGAAPGPGAGLAARPERTPGATCSSAFWPFRTTSSVATTCWRPSPPGSPTRPGPWPRSWWIAAHSTIRAARLLEALVAEHLKQHGGDTEASLAAVSSLGSVRDDLERLDDTDLQASLAAAASRPAGRRRRRGDGDLRLLVPPRRRAVPHPPLPPRGRPGPRLRRPRRGARPRGRAQGDPARQGRRGRPPRPLRPGGRDQRRTGAPRDRAGLQPGHLR